MRYIGETKRHFLTRINEHISGQPNATEVTTHNHCPKKEDFKVLLRTRFTKTAEAIFIKSSPRQVLLNEKEQQVPILLF